MALYKVIRDTVWADIGDWLEDIDEVFVQKVDMVTENRRLVPMDNYGLLIPRTEVRDSMVKIQANGIDKRW